ncbi:unnamed protein product [Periconia digitata]|uniref:Uncharacterized protein n=1 Tax=Periconia digitata TaxID=1303443 RepID=A0A9W4XP84_9PLEO|nr:unnamed protein product [Periconia digitata]
MSWIATASTTNELPRSCTYMLDTKIPHSLQLVESVMAPIRRYLRITKHSVLEVRIYLDRPADAEAWLLRRENPALPRVIQAVRPLVLPKLREENERFKTKSKGKAKKKGVKDMVAEDDFEVSIFLTELSSRHSLMIKQKVFKEKPSIQSNSGKLTGWLTSGSSEQPVMVDENTTESITIREEEDDGIVKLADIPEKDDSAEQGSGSEKRKRRRGDNRENPITEIEDSDDSFQLEVAPSKKRSKSANREVDQELNDGESEGDGEKKKLALNTSYEGFSIYGRVLCLVVKRKNRQQQKSTGNRPASSEQMMENWVSTQAAIDHEEEIDDDEDNG